MLITSLHNCVIAKSKHLEYLRGEISRFFNRNSCLLFECLTVFWISLSLKFTLSFLRPLLENVSGLQKCKWILFCGFFWFCFVLKWRGFTIPVTQSTRQMIARKKSSDSSDSSELEYRTILFDNIKTCVHLHTFFWFNRSIESVSIFVISLLAVATRMLKADIFYF